jgi:ABC-type multidrug transport system fused ATPase/permease subunit
MFALNMIMHLTQLPEVIAGLAAATGAYQTIHKIILRRPRIMIDRGLTPARFTGLIELQDVHYAYVHKPVKKPVLAGLTMTVRPGEHVALVGRSGAGKSTVCSLLLCFSLVIFTVGAQIFHLLTRLYDFESGSIKVSGYDIQTLSPVYLRHRIGLVTQEPTLLSASLSPPPPNSDSQL